ncbi:hypothetical protein LJC02_02510, partial [Breznakia sp. OttesenSCG-928-G09]|nr:hypothetical protein [Breznakia sp. OttesenSCG-928-G09]
VTDTYKGTDTHAYDLVSKFTIDYSNTNYHEKLTYTIYKSDPSGIMADPTPIVGETEMNYNSTLTLPDIDDGQYLIVLKTYNPLGISDSGTLFVNLTNVEATVDINRKNNPTEASVGSDNTEATNSWEIKDKDGNIVGSGNDTDDPMDVIKTLPEGSYTLENTATITTILGNDVTDTASEPFVIRHPEASVNIDKKENPSEITGGKKLDDSDLLWEIKDKDGNTVEKGMGDRVPNDVINNLPEGEYTVIFTEVSQEDETDVASDTFIIKKPNNFNSGETPTQKPSTTPKGETRTPATNDATNIQLLFLLAGSSFAVMVRKAIKN